MKLRIFFSTHPWSETLAMVELIPLELISSIAFFTFSTFYLQSKLIRLRGVFVPKEIFPLHHLLQRLHRLVSLEYRTHSFVPLNSGNINLPPSSPVLKRRTRSDANFTSEKNKLSSSSDFQQSCHQTNLLSDNFDHLLLLLHKLFIL